MKIPADIAQIYEAWARRGRFVTIPEGHRIFCVQEGQGPDLLLVHGFPSTSHDFAAALPLLTPHFRVTTFDHLGFGFSDKPAGAVSYSLLDQARRAGEVARMLGVGRAPLNGGLDILGRIARYNLERTQVPIRIIWGDQDPIAVIEIGRRLAELSGGPLTVLEGVGHYPQMEAPEAWATAVIRDTQP